MTECGCGARLDHYDSGSPYVQITICPRHSEENVARLERSVAASDTLIAQSSLAALEARAENERLEAERDRLRKEIKEAASIGAQIAAEETLRERDHLRDHVAILEAELAAEVDSRQREVDRLRNVIVSRHGDEPIAILAELDSSRAGNERLREALELLEAERDRLREALARLAKAARRLDEHEFGDAIAAAEVLLR